MKNLVSTAGAVVGLALGMMAIYYIMQNANKFGENTTGFALFSGIFISVGVFFLSMLVRFNMEDKEFSHIIIPCETDIALYGRQ